MKDTEKQVEEMVRKCCPRYENERCDRLFECDLDCCEAKIVKNIFKDSIVLSREELHEIEENAYQVGVATGKKVGGKETAEKLIKKIKRTAVPVAVGKYTNMKFIETSEEELNTIAKQFGVEIKE
jgi:hypothetical protein